MGDRLVGPALLSDWLFTSAFGVYMLAALLCSAEYALTRHAVDPPAFAVRLGRSGVALTVLGALLHLASVVLRGVATGRVPWGNMYEYLSAVGLIAVGAWLYLVCRHDLRRMSVFVLPPVASLLFLAGNRLYAEAAPLVPSLRSYWIVVHVAAAIMASGVFLLSGVVSALHLAGSGEFSRKGAPRRRLPPAEDLDKIAYRTGTVGFLTLTFAIVTGAVWAEQAWGRFWGWDPKETVAFVSWVCYAAYLHARATAGWRGRRSAWLNVVGMVVVLFNLFFVNLVAVGLHSYAGVD
ncbi:c-type cytochrome biogenesis protein CcsB [Saccharothrix texasensis]|uniref:Cytochrome c-type biogenesis protein CcsB n=1 Tax=Saccharothrix texasensis TaxID=103734 RepID=A0A3N1GYS5_9PSEU|nr:c-type cytochrome biogenesis protein CcsB [Saccharothrix texasensis]ROP35483.1 cytochrome c-type biogenesis protein CcsB [Saccharothrix texasensis]